MAGKLKFNLSEGPPVESTKTLAQFRRNQFVLYDLKYLLTMVPPVWTDKMRQSFLHGLKEFLLMCQYLQVDNDNNKFIKTEVILQFLSTFIIYIS